MYFAAALSFANFVAAWVLLPESRAGSASRVTAGVVPAGAPMLA